jgi:hypothetical protein
MSARIARTGTGAAALDQADHAGAGDAGAMGDAEAFQFPRDDSGGAHLLEADFRMGVDVAADFDQFRLDPEGFRADGGRGVVRQGGGG